MKKLIASAACLVLLATPGLLAPRPAQAGAEDGPIVHRDSVNAQGADRYSIWFKGGEDAIIWVSGDGDTDLDLYVYDENGNRVVFDDDYTDECVVRFYPRRTGRYTVRIVNRGSVYNNYVLRTN